jgi:D-amino-acid dehydrogenase
VEGAHCDVAVVGGGLVGLSLAYELATEGARVTVVDAGFPGRATDAGAGILSPDTTAVDEPAWWDFVQGAGAHYPNLLERLRADGVDTDTSRYAVCGVLSVGLRASEEGWFAPFADLVTSRSGGVVHEITPGAARELFPPLGEVHRVLHNPAAARVDGRGMADALRRGAVQRGVCFVDGAMRGVETAPGPEGGATRSVRKIRVDGQPDVDCGALAVAGGAWSAAMGEWLGCPLPVTPTKGQIVHLGTAAESGGWPIVQPLLTHYLVPWPGGRVACGGTFEVSAGFSATVTAAGVHELLRECLSVAPGLAGAEYLHTRVGLRPTSPDDRPLVGTVPGWGNAWVVTGHGASGLLLGPYSSRLVADEITGVARVGGGPGIPPEFDPARFG